MKIATLTRTNYAYKPIDELPFPDYEPFGIKDMMDNYSMATRLLYRYPRPYPRPFNIVASRSCPFDCSFCIHNHARPRYRARAVESIMEEIKIMYERYHFNILIILDELFAVNKKRMIEFSEALLDGKQKYGWDFDWMFQTHACAKLDLASLNLAKRAGCFFFSYGLESASPIVLKSMKKKLKIEAVIEAIKLAQEARVGFGANIIFGDLAETEETFAESLAFWLKYCVRAEVFLGVLKPYPGSALFDTCIEKGIIKDKRQYYETIDQVTLNMTSLPDTTWQELLSLAVSLEHSWLFVKLATEVRCEKEEVNDFLAVLACNGYKMYKVWATCPYCGEESMYRQMMAEAKSTWMGIGCTKCNSKIRIEIPMEVENGHKS